MDHDATELNCTFQEPARRRAWLLCKALECVPLDRALDLARMAEQFVLGGCAEKDIDHSISPDLAARAPDPQGGPDSSGYSPAAEESAGTGKSKLLLTPEQRRRLVDRLAAGARNVELASEFGIAPRQVQGIRISQARLAKLSRNPEPRAPQNAPETIEGAVRFLRQQDDVVVPQDGGAFLVNGRFRLGAAELIERANRIRARQGQFGSKQIGGDRNQEEIRNPADCQPSFREISPGIRKIDQLHEP